MGTDERHAVVTSMLTLLSWAQRRAGSKSLPLAHVQVQLWVREVRRLLREIAAKPSFYWRDERPEMTAPPALPMYYCRECGHSGWIGDTLILVTARSTSCGGRRVAAVDELR
ncbi:MAG: hypothetical protein ACM3ZE_14770 [Myxococcales bacterium]